MPSRTLTLPGRLRLENLEGPQASVKRLATIPVKGQKVGAINFNLVQLALSSLERVTIPNQTTQQVQLRR